MVLVAEEKGTAYSINTAFVGISRRAESVDRKTLVQTFVDLGPLIHVLSTRDHQIVYGRRGTGKTHALLYVTEQLKAENAVPVYIDLRNMGSSGGIYADAQIPLTQRATRLLLDVLGTVHEDLLEYAVAADLDLSVLGPMLDKFAESITELEVVGEVHRETKQEIRAAREDSSALKLSLQAKPDLEASMSSANKLSSQAESRFEESGQVRYRVHFGSLGKALGDLPKALSPARLLVVLDEWSTIPLELQPYLADLIRRAVFPIAGITVKIAAIEQRSNFKIGSHGDYTGIEIGADASADVDLDDYISCLTTMRSEHLSSSRSFCSNTTFRKRARGQSSPIPRHSFRRRLRSGTRLRTLCGLLRECPGTRLTSCRLQRRGVLMARFQFPPSALRLALGSSVTKRAPSARIRRRKSFCTGLLTK